jgi:hypothetical protein
LKMQINKSDRNDAVGIARMMQCGWYKEVRVKDLDTRSRLSSSAELCSSRSSGISRIKSEGSYRPRRKRKLTSGLPLKADVYASAGFRRYEPIAEDC